MSLRRFNVGCAVVVTLLAVFAPIYAACGGNARQRTLHASFTTTSVACDGLEAWDRTRQEQIVNAALSKQAGIEKLDEHRAEMDKAYASCALAYRAIAAASTSKDELSLNHAIVEAKKVYDAIMKLKGAL